MTLDHRRSTVGLMPSLSAPIGEDRLMAVNMSLDMSLETAMAQRPGSAGLHRGSQQLLTLALGQTAPDAVRLVNLERMSPARHHGGAGLAHGLRRVLTPHPRRSALTFGVEEVGARHAAAGGVQLPIPHVSVGAWKAPGIGHGVAHLRCSHSPTIANAASTGAHRQSGGDVIRTGRICIDIDAAVIKTVGRIDGRIKSEQAIFEDRSGLLPAREIRRPHPAEGRTDVRECAFARVLAVINGWPRGPNRGIVPRSVITIAYHRAVSAYIEQPCRYTPSRLRVNLWYRNPSGGSRLSQQKDSNGYHPVGEHFGVSRFPLMFPFHNTKLGEKHAWPGRPAKTRERRLM